MDPLKSYSGRDGRIEEHVYETGKKYSHEGDLFVLLKRLMPRISDDIDFPFTGGAVGYVGYGAARNGANRHEDDLGFPDVNFNIYETIIVFDHVLNEVTVLHTEISEVQKTPDLDALADKPVVGREQEDSSVELSDYTCAVTQQQFEDLVREAKGAYRGGGSRTDCVVEKIGGRLQWRSIFIVPEIEKAESVPLYVLHGIR